MKLVIILIGVILLTPISNVWAKVDAVGKVTSTFGQTWIKPENAMRWTALKNGAVLKAGDKIKTDLWSSAHLRMDDESLIRLSQSSVFEIESVDVNAFWRVATGIVNAFRQSASSTYRLLKGKMWGRNNNKKLSSTIYTATATIGIRGTEYSVVANDDGSSIVSITEGVVQAENSYGKILVHTGQQAVIPVDSFPQMQTIVKFEHSVQWTVAVPEIINIKSYISSDSVFFGEILNAYENHQYSQLLVLLEQDQSASSVNNKIIELWLNLKIGEMNQSLTSLKELYQQRKPIVDIKNLLSFNYFLLGNISEAQVVFNDISDDEKNVSSWLLAAYFSQARHALDDAEKNYLKALALEPNNIIALIQLAKLKMGSKEIDVASQYIQKVLNRHPQNRLALNLQAFISLTKNETKNALNEWKSLVENNKADAETYFGLSLAQMRLGMVNEAMGNMAIAVSLQPRKSLFLSYWGKMLYQVRRFDKALTVLDSAIRADESDPTPWLYKAIILRDLNQPIKAIEHIHEAEKRNGNQAVIRSSSLLDEDAAIQNLDLSKLYSQLGLNEWAKLKGLSATSLDYLNASAHIQNSGAFAAMNGRSYPAASSALMARIIQPASVNAFGSLNRYSHLFESPETDVEFKVSTGGHSQQSLDLIVSGAKPSNNFAWGLSLNHFKTDGWNDTNGEEFNNVSLLGKWQSSYRNNWLFTLSGYSNKQYDDLLNRYSSDSRSDPKDISKLDVSILEIGNYHQISANNHLITYFALQSNNGMIKDYELISKTAIGNSFVTLEQIVESDYQHPNYQLQIQDIIKLNSHELFFGASLFKGEFIAKTENHTGIYDPLHNIVSQINGKNDSKFKRDYMGVYFRDRWDIANNVQIDASLYIEKMNSANALTGGEWSQNVKLPRIGLTWNVNTNNTIRFANFDYLLPFLSARIDPITVAGIPIYRNAHEGSIIKERTIRWDTEWKKALVYAEFFDTKESFLSAVPSTTTGEQIESTSYSEQKGGLMGINYILDDVDWLSKGDNALISELSNYTVKNFGNSKLSRRETFWYLQFNHVAPSGIVWSLNQIFRKIDFESNTKNENINVTSVKMSYLVSEKQQLDIEIENLMGKSFNWLTDDYSTFGIAPERLLKVAYTIKF